MRNLIDFFVPKNHFQTIITPHMLDNHKRISLQLLDEIRKYPSQFVKYVNQKDQQSMHEIEKTALVHLVVMHSHEFNEEFEQLTLSIQTKDTWINDNILGPYQHFIRKLMLSNEQYNKIRTINLGWNGELSPYNDYNCKVQMRQNPKDYFNFETLCFCINMLNELFAFLKKVPTLGRYYSKQENHFYESFVYISSYQVTLFYFSMKFIAHELIVHHRTYLATDYERSIFKEILSQHLQPINEQLKGLLLNKYFNPIERGIKVTLFQMQNQDSETREALCELCIINPQDIRKIRKNRRFLGKKIFGSGDFDGDSFQSSIMLISSQLYTSRDLEQLYDKENIDHFNVSNLSNHNMNKTRIPSHQQRC